MIVIIVVYVGWGRKMTVWDLLADWRRLRSEQWVGLRTGMDDQRKAHILCVCGCGCACLLRRIWWNDEENLFKKLNIKRLACLRFIVSFRGTRAFGKEFSYAMLSLEGVMVCQSQNHLSAFATSPLEFFFSESEWERARESEVLLIDQQWVVAAIQSSQQRLWSSPRWFLSKIVVKIELGWIGLD